MHGRMKVAMISNQHLRGSSTPLSMISLSVLMPYSPFLSLRKSYFMVGCPWLPLVVLGREYAIADLSFVDCLN